MKLKRPLDKEKMKVIGLMSGTSANGIDACIVEIKRGGDNVDINQLGFKTYKFLPFLQKEILKVSDPGFQNIDEVIGLDFLLGEYFAAAAKKIVKSCGLNLKDIDLIGSHGQTLRHLPLKKKIGPYWIRGTLQIGEPQIISTRTGIITVADFRKKDIALGREGAPLTPLAHFHLFNQKDKSQIVLNIGGIANFSFLPRGQSQEKAWGIDTGPGNILIDNLTRRYFRKNFDKDGKIAFKGKIIQPLLSQMLEQVFSLLEIKKSLGREDFDQKFTRKFVKVGKKYSAKPEDLISTASELTLRSIHTTLKNLSTPKAKIEDLILCGGGALNRYLYTRLKESFYPARVYLSDELGYNPLAVESISFALFAFLTLSQMQRGITGSVKAGRIRVLGKICLP